MLMKSLLKSLFMQLEPVFVRACRMAGPTADALILIHHDNALVGDMGGLGWTDPLAGGILAVVANERNIGPGYIGIGADFLTYRLGKKHPPGCGIFRLTGNRAGVTSNTSF
jgi:hypothetical protein